MKELKEITTAYDRAQRAGKQTALATVVHVEGSSYRRAGARMLVTEDGQLTGAISGGCLEGDALRKARLAMAQRKAVLVTYDTTDEDDAKLGVGLGCNGIIQILIEPIDAGFALNPIVLFKTLLSKREAVVLITIFNMEDRHQNQYGTCMLIDRDGRSIGTLLRQEVAEAVVHDALKVLQQPAQPARTYRYENGYTCLIELLQPAISLVIAGAGNDAVPLVQIAKVLGWEVTLADGRANYNTAERFPWADRRIVARPDELLVQLMTDRRTVFVLMTHNYNYDLSLLGQLLTLPLPYIGVLGPKSRLIRMLAECYGADAPSADRTNIHGPAGLDIGSESAEEIALSIVSEIQCVLNQRDGAPLANKAHVHDRYLTDKEYTNIESL
ncbi:XdhC family protein [Mucilaginibacter lacusdianchii]|uniref:XdhC family protein n=1 Tax=Mucilaginibacter lacusdianchii TaxID=2684211 RepID=UPI00131CF80F|nr:XdhC/CoxI family protein [Mucilaginibacter sp. JXJ CY 39]